MYTQHPILKEKNQICRIFSKLIKKEKLKYHMVISIQTLCSVLSRSTLLSLYSHESSWEWCNKCFSHLDLGILCHSSLQILSSSVRLDGERWWTAIFRSLQRCSIGGHRVVPKPVLCYFSCVLRVIVLLEGEPSAQSEVLSTLEEVFFQDISVLGRIHLSFNYNQSSCPCSWKTPP